jgi:hypothetical protein
MTKFLELREMDEAISEVAELARREQVRIALVGGAAMEIYGSDRMAKDVDFASLAHLSELTIVSPLPFGGYAGLSRSGHPVNVIVRSDEYAPLYEEAIDHAVADNLLVPVVGPEYLAALKMAAGREKDELDLRTLIRLGVLDLPKTRKIVRQHLGEYAARSLDSFCDEVAWLKSREK